jgi:hypothetical protein
MSCSGIKGNLIALREMELKWLDLGIRRDKRLRMRIRNVNIANKVKINVVVVGSHDFRDTIRECLNFTIIQDEGRFKN